MSNEARRAAVAALVRLAESSDYHDRADAGRSPADFAEMPEARGPLLEVVLPGDHRPMPVRTSLTWQ